MEAHRHKASQLETDQDQAVTILDPERDIDDRPEFDSAPVLLFPNDSTLEHGQFAPFAPEPGEAQQPADAPPMDSVTQEYIAFIIRQTSCRVLDIITAGNVNQKVMGARALVLQFELKAGSYRNQKELAKKLVLTESRTSQLLKSVREGIARLYRANCAPR